MKSNIVAIAIVLGLYGAAVVPGMEHINVATVSTFEADPNIRGRACNSTFREVPGNTQSPECDEYEDGTIILYTDSFSEYDAPWEGASPQTTEDYWALNTIYHEGCHEVVGVNPNGQNAWESMNEDVCYAWGDYYARQALSKQMLSDLASVKKEK